MIETGDMTAISSKTDEFIKDLRTTIIAKDLSDDELRLLQTVSSEKRFVKGEIIITEKSKDRDLYVICEGRVRIEPKMPGNFKAAHRQIFNVRHGQVFGEVAFLDGDERSASARARGNVRVYVMDAQKLETLLKENPAIGYKFLRNLGRMVCKRLRSNNAQWRSAMLEGTTLRELDYY